jgi:DNA polymerase III subunit delta'
MSLAAALELARHGRLYPAVILHGGTTVERADAALQLARTLLCAEPPAQRPCGRCRHCARIAWPGAELAGKASGRALPEEAAFHPDFRVLQREDGRIAIAVEATRTMLTMAQTAPFEGRGQVFAIAGAETLSAEAANTLLKILEEPPVRAPRHFFLLAPSRLDLLPTLRSRSLALYLGATEPLDGAKVAAVGVEFGDQLAAYSRSRGGLHLLRMAAALGESGDFRDARASRPFGVAAAVVRGQVDQAAPALRSRLLALAEALLQAGDYRLRGIPAERILEGLVCRHLGLV